MKKQSWKRFLCVGLTVACGMGMLTGCGEEEKIDYSIEGISEETQSESVVGENAVSQYAGEPNWVDSWTIEEERDSMGGLTVDVTVDAQVVLPDTEEMVVVEVKVPEFDAKFRERVVKTLLETASDAHTLEDSYNVKEEYIGENNGITYELWFSNGYGEVDWAVNNQYFTLNAIDFEEIRPEGYENYTRYMPHPYMTCDRYTEVGDNACELSLEDAEKQARELLEELGLEYPVLAYTRPLIWGDETLSASNIYDWPANGYAFTFEYGMDELSFISFGANFDYLQGAGSYTVEELVPYSMRALATVDITDKGILNMHVNSPVETVKISEPVELLPLDTITEIMKSEMGKSFENYSGNMTAQYTYLELIYFRVKDEANEGYYSYVPAWRLSDQVGAAALGNWEIRNPVVINAIDGTWIDAGAELGPDSFWR